MAKLTPYQWQTQDVETLERNHFTGLLAIEAGGSKTLIATLAIARAQPVVTLIIAPKSTHHTAWIPTLRDNANVTPRIIGNDNKATKSALFDFEMGYPGVYLASPQFVTRADVSSWRGDMIVHDESHQGNTMKSKLQRKLSGYHVSDGKPLAERFTRRLALSGTPMKQNFAALWGTMRFLWPELDSRGQVADRNAIMWMNDRMSSQEVYTNQRDAQGNPKKVKQYLSESQPGRLISEMPNVIIHKRREACCVHHPNGFLSTEAPQVIEREVELTAKQKKSIREMNDHMFTYLRENPLIAEISLTQKQRLRQLTLGEADAEFVMVDTADGPVERTTIRFREDCVSPFIDETIDILSKLDEFEPVVIFLEGQRFAEVLTKRLTAAGYPAAEYSGVRKADLNEFGKGYQVLIGVISAIGTGTDGLQAKCNTEIWVEEPVSITLKAQGSARLDRMGGRQVQRYVLIDSEGIQRDRLDDNVAKQLMVNRSLRKVA
jgi:hypothetical protein